MSQLPPASQCHQEQLPRSIGGEAARLEGLNKYLGTEIIGSEELEKETGDEFLTRPLGRYQPKGSDRVVAVYEIIGSRKGNEEPDWLSPFRDALSAFRKRD